MSHRLRVGIDAELARITPRTGHGMVWHHLVNGLRERVDVIEIGRRQRLRDLVRRPFEKPRPIDVWLVDGHSWAPFPVDGLGSVAFAHDVRWADPVQLPSVPLSFLSRVAPATEEMVRASTFTAVPSEFAAQGLRDLYGLDREIRVVPPGVDLDLFGTARQRRIQAKGTLPRGVPAGPYVLFVGSVEPRKNIDVLRRAMQIVADSGVEARLVLRLSAAPGLDSRALIEAASGPFGSADGRVNEVVVLPPLSQPGMADVVAHACVVCLPSEYEGFGLPALEAMAAGVAVVVANRGSLPEVVGGAGIVVEPRPDALASALLRLLTDPEHAQSVAERGALRAREFSWDRTVDGVHTLLVEAAGVGAFVREHPKPRSWVACERIARCPVCAQPAATSTTASLMGLARCVECGTRHARTQAPPAEQRLGSGARTMPPGWPNYLTDPMMFECFQVDRAEQLLDLIDARAARPGRLLDVRCDVGAMLTAAARRGWQATGVEPVPAIARIAARRVQNLGTEIIVADLATVSGPFDLVVACDWLEQMPSATDSLTLLRELAGPGSLIVVVTPNWRGAARRWDGENWHHFRALETVTYFDRATLRHALGQAGLIDVELHCVTWTSDDLTIAAHSLVPIRRLVLARTSGAGRFESAVVRRLLRAYDRFGLGDVLVGFARVPGATDDSHPHTTAPGTS